MTKFYCFVAAAFVFAPFAMTMLNQASQMAA